MRAWFSLTLVGIGAILLGAASFLVTSLPAHYVSSGSAHNLQGIIANIAASLTFIFVYGFGAQILFQRDLRKFRLFFGDLADPKASRLIYPQFSLSAECENALGKVSPATRFSKQMTIATIPKFVDIPQIVSSNDLLGLVVYTTGSGKFIREPPQPMPDELAVGGLAGALPFGFVSFGLTSNEVTDVYLSTDQHPLFSIEDPSGEPKIVTCKGRYGRDDRYQHGLVLRFRPDPENYPTQFWFICAGVAAVGTPAAAWHLVHNWRKYHKKYGTEDFLVVFRTSNHMAGYRTQQEVVHFGRSEAAREVST